MMEYLTLGVSNMEKASAFFGAISRNPESNQFTFYLFS